MPDDKSTYSRLKLLPPIFRKQDAEKVAPHTGMFLSRALRKGLLYRINRGNYINLLFHDLPSIEEVACFLRPPSYISCEWALTHHGISIQVPTVCSVITLHTAVGKKRNILYQGITVEFSKIVERLFFGFEYCERFYVASPEKAVLDTLYLRKMLPAADELEWEMLNPQALRDMADRYPAFVRRILQALSVPR